MLINCKKKLSLKFRRGDHLKIKEKYILMRKKSLLLNKIK